MKNPQPDWLVPNVGIPKKLQRNTRKPTAFINMTAKKDIESLKDKKFLDGELVCYFDIIFWSWLRDEWVIRFSDDSKDGIVEFTAPTLKEAVEQVYQNQTEQEVTSS
jgi:hypothetical protein